MVLLLVVLLLFVLFATGQYDPTIAELKTAEIVKHSPQWGQLARNQNSLRVLCLGGSNTIPSAERTDYVAFLDMYIRNNISRNAYFRNHSWAVSNGISGQSPASFVGKKFPFEAQEVSLWPNVILLEFAVNIPDYEVGTNVSIINLERLVRSLVYKYKVNNVPTPDFVFFNLLQLRALYAASFNMKSKHQRRGFLAGYNNITILKHSESQILQLASFYGLPVVSFGRAMLPAAKRHFLASNQSYDRQPWPYLVDPTHLSKPFGTSFAVDKILGPFFKRAIKGGHHSGFDHSSSTNITSVAAAMLPTAMPVNDSVRLLPAGPVLVELQMYSIFGQSAKMAELKDLIISDSSNSSSISVNNNNKWVVSVFPHLRVPLCFGSTSAGSVGRLSVTLPRECSRLNCRVGLTFLHSWNQTLIGDAECVLQRMTTITINGINTSENTSTSSTTTAAAAAAAAAAAVEVSRVTVRGQSGVGRHTFNVLNLFPAANLSAGPHRVTCTNLYQDRLSCMNFLSIRHEVII